MRRREILIGSCALVIGLGTARPASAADILRIFYLDDDAPFSFRGADGRAQGSLIETLDLLGRRAGITFDYRDVPWVRAQQLIRSGELDAFLTLPTEERRSYALFAPTPVFEARARIYHRAMDPRFAPPPGRAGLAALNELTLLGASPNRAIDPAKAFKVKDYVTMAEMVAVGHGDYFLADPIIMRPILAKSDLAKRLSDSPASFLEPLTFCLGIRKGYPNAAAIVERWDQAVRTARQTGAIAPLEPGD